MDCFRVCNVQKNEVFVVIRKDCNDRELIYKEIAECIGGIDCMFV